MNLENPSAVEAGGVRFVRPRRHFLYFVKFDAATRFHNTRARGATTHSRRDSELAS